MFGYRYDTETGLYYLNSRYYNPEWGRFINADGITAAAGDLLSANMFAYCKNNPVNMSDPSGYFCLYIGNGQNVVLSPDAPFVVHGGSAALSENSSKSATLAAVGIIGVKSLPDSANVIRFGQAAAGNLIENSLKDPEFGTMSVKAGGDVFDMILDDPVFTNKTACITSVGKLRSEGWDVKSIADETNIWHAAIIPKNNPLSNGEADELSNFLYECNEDIDDLFTLLEEAY